MGRVAVIGGGLAGSCAAAELAATCDVVVFDQGRRPGGRASHRTVNHETQNITGEAEAPPGAHEFDHGAQFIRADDAAMKEVVAGWLQRGWVAEWKARFGRLGGGDADEDFFGVPSSEAPVYVGVGGMHAIPNMVLEGARAEAAGKLEVRAGTRVSGMRKSGDGRWELLGVSGKAALHDTAEATAAAAEPSVLDTVDAVLLTDISSTAAAWHRASAGIPDSVRGLLPPRVRIPMFACMIALEAPIAPHLPYDAFTVGSARRGCGSADGDNALWFAAAMNTKPPSARGGPAHECWVLVSTPAYAVNEIAETTMRDPVTGRFKPQENSYLNTVPGPALYKAFAAAVGAHLPEGVTLPSKPSYLQAQRWGSGLPIHPSLAAATREVCECTYAPLLAQSLVFPTKDAAPQDYVGDDAARVYFAGDFVADRNPGAEAAVLSGLAAARHIASKL
eukprot:TRINITY_DN21412_c0_g1_i1.p1 TRINITY_DN21412_c0_g1~~TRINITY_DN21412_c0_g1_i1.p1  ORF type:complete len:448 (+),score=136.32 TRINITY_DN21412_c0_g1_i1:57-1400(+)